MNSGGKALLESRFSFTVIGDRETAIAEAPLQKASAWKGALRPFILLAIDALLLLGALVAAHQSSGFWSSIQDLDIRLSADNLALGAAFIGLSAVLLACSRVLESQQRASLTRQWVRVLGVVSFAAMLLEFQGMFWPLGWNDSGLLFLLWIHSAFFLLVGGTIAQQALHTVLGEKAAGRLVIVVGYPDSSHADSSAQHTSYVAQLVGAGPTGNGASTGTPMMTSSGQESEELRPERDLKEISRILLTESHREVVLAVPADKYSEMQSEVTPLVPDGVTVHTMLYPPVTGHNSGDASPELFMKAKPFSWQYENLKRVFDLLAGSVALVLCAPAMAVIAISIKLNSPGPILYSQTRVGRAGQLFKMYKFRSMRQNADALLEGLKQSNEASGPMFKVRGDPRITEVGKIIRRLSLDELPQLFNVLRGTMSLVGPRPPLPREVAEYEPWHFGRLEAMPGITGLWQVSRDGVSDFEQMVKLDQEYMDKWSLAADVAILLKTFNAAVGGRGAY